MVTLFCLYVWTLRDGEPYLTSILECTDLAALATYGRRLFNLDQPNGLLTHERAELRIARQPSPDDTTDRVERKWDVVPGLVPPGCRRARACVVVDGVPRDMLAFMREQAAVNLGTDRGTI